MKAKFNLGQITVKEEAAGALTLPVRTPLLHTLFWET
jgi:hypothetical protein